MSLSDVIANLQSSIDGVDSDTSMRDILKYMYQARNLTGLSSAYDSVGVMPGADDAYDGMIAFSAGDDAIYKFVDSSIDGGTIRGWHLADSNYSIPPSNVSQGSNYGYAAGGRFNALDVIDKYPFASDGDATDVGDLLYGVVQNTGTSSKNHGYSLGGNSPTDPTSPPNSIDTIQKWPTSTDANSTDVADLLGEWTYAGSTFSETHGYATGNNISAGETIQKHQFSNDGDATDVGDLLNSMNGCTGTSCSTSHGYVAGGANPSFPASYTDQIQKFAFATDGDATDVGDLLVGAQFGSGAQSTTHGYHCGGQENVGYGYQNVIEKYSHSTDENSADVADMLATGYFAFGSSSTTHGYVAGLTPPSSNVTIQKFSFSADEDATDVGDLTTGRYNAASTHF